MTEKSDLFIVWNPFQRRSETLSSIFSLKPLYFHYTWEERGKMWKALSYIPKFFSTLFAMSRYRPRIVFVQLAPTTLLYTAAFYRLFTGIKLVSDCHNTMIYDDHWIKWPLAKHLLRWSDITLVHNDDVKRMADALHVDTLVLRDPLPSMHVSSDIGSVGGIVLNSQVYVIIPCGIAPDEPVQEMFQAITRLPDVLFVMTWFKEKLPEELINKAPSNLMFTGFLPESEFNALFANARAALVLTRREGTQPSGAAEAISLGIPLVVSAVNTTKRLYADAAVFVDNEVDSIVEGVRRALDNQAALSESITSLRQALVNDAASQIEAVKALLVSANG